MFIGYRILIHDRRRLIGSTLGIGMAVIILFVEMGFFFGVIDSQTNIARLVDGDLVVLHPRRTNLNKWTSFPRQRLDQIAALPEVEAAIPYYKTTVGMLNADTGQVRRIVAIAFPPETPPIKLNLPPEYMARLTRPDSIIFDRRSRHIYGKPRVGDEAWINQKSFLVVGKVRIGPTIIHDGAILMSESSLLALDPKDQPVMGVLRLRPGADVDAVRRKIAQANLDDVTIWTRKDLLEREVAYTITAAPIGLLFGFGVIAGLIVGTMVCYQILFNEITDHISQFATLRAMGYSDGFIRRIILEQSGLLSFAGFVAGIVAAVGIYFYIQHETALLMRITLARCAFGFLLTVGMCVAGGLLAMRRVTIADPADLY